MNDMMQMMALLQLMQQQQNQRKPRRKDEPAQQRIMGNSMNRMAALQESQNRNAVMPKMPSMMPGISRQFVQEGANPMTPGGMPMPILGGGGGPLPVGTTGVASGRQSRRREEKSQMEKMLKMLQALQGWGKKPENQAASAGSLGHLAGGNPLMALLNMSPNLLNMLGIGA